VVYIHIPLTYENSFTFTLLASTTNPHITVNTTSLQLNRHWFIKIKRNSSLSTTNAFKNNSHLSKYVRHLIEQNHTLDSIQNTVQVLQYQNKGAHLNTYERFHIYAEYINKNHLNDEHTIFPNKLFNP